jgi:hypothetical protein
MGEIYQGVLEGSEDTMNSQLSKVTYTNTDGIDWHIDSVYIRGSSILFVVVRDIFANSPMFLKKERVVRGNRDGHAGNLRDKGLARKLRIQDYEIDRRFREALTIERRPSKHRHFTILLVTKRPIDRHADSPGRQRINPFRFLK